MTLQQLHYVITISEAGSMNKASEQLYIAQPSLTSSIKELEKELGRKVDIVTNPPEHMRPAFRKNLEQDEVRLYEAK